MRTPALLGAGRGRGMAVIAGLALLQGAAAAAAAFATRSLFGLMHEGGPVSAAAGPLAILIGAGLVIAAAGVAFRWLGERLGQSYALDIREALFAHAASMSARDVDVRRAGYMSLRFVGDMAALKDWPALGLPRLIAAAAILPSTVAALWLLHPPFGALGFVVFALAALLVYLAGRALPDLHLKARKRRARLAADMAERMPMAPDLGRLGRRKTETALLRRRGGDMIDAALTLVRRREGLAALSDAAAGFAAAGVVWITLTGDATPATAAAGLAALGLGLTALRELATVADIRAGFLAARQKCEAALARATRAAEKKGGLSLPTGPLAVALEDVSIGPVEGLSAEVEAGCAARLAGGAGAGKSLVLSVLAGRDAAEAGEARIGGRPVDGLSPAAVAARVALIREDAPLLRGSFRRALTLGLPERPSDEATTEAARAFGLARLLIRLGGLDGSIQEGGRDLSSGERLRIALARAALQKPDLILFDETPPDLAAALLARFDETARPTVIFAERGQDDAPLGLEPVQSPWAAAASSIHSR
ncbi:MAG: ATP-binding cassette domain-containing protein [Pseudomonadota bacterium]